MKATIFGILALIATVTVSLPGCSLPPGATTNDGARLTVVSVDLRGRGDRRRVQTAVEAAAAGVRCPRVVGDAHVTITMAPDGGVGRLDLRENGGAIFDGGCIIPQLRTALAGSAPGGARVTFRIRAD